LNNLFNNVDKNIFTSPAISLAITYIRPTTCATRREKCTEMRKWTSTS
jgi:hypothetical protein